VPSCWTRAVAVCALMWSTSRLMAKLVDIRVPNPAGWLSMLVNQNLKRVRDLTELLSPETLFP
jgi:hypothetical protein